MEEDEEEEEEGALSPDLGMPLEELPPSFFDGFPPLGMRLAILEFFLFPSVGDDSSLGEELSLEDFCPDLLLLLSSLSLEDAPVLPLLLALEEEEEEGDVLIGAVMDGDGVFVDI